MPSCHIHTYAKIEANRALVLRNPMAERAKGRPSDALSVMVIDEDEFHANSAKSMLSELNYYGVGDKAQHGKEVGESVAQQKDGTKTITQLKWIPFLESKFLYALQILGANASPGKIKIIMNMDTVTTKQISAHLQKHRKRMEREQNMATLMDSYGNCASSSKSVKTHHTIPYTPGYHSEDVVQRTMMPSLFGDTQGVDVSAAMRRALQLGAVFDEFQYSNGPSSDEPCEVIGHITGEDGIVDEANGSNSSSHDQVAAQTYNSRVAHAITFRNNCHHDQVSNISKVPVEGLVDCPDSEDSD
ncbi:hypothetical protein ACQJBY_056291 [Aegilops geniculata]